MMATILMIADAVVARLNNAPFVPPLAAERHYQPRYDLEQMTTRRVSVVPRGLSNTTLDRNRDAFDYEIDVAIQQKTDMSAASLDALMNLVEEIVDMFRSSSLAGAPEARCVEVKNVPIYALEHLDELHQFTSLVTLTFRVWR